MQFTIIYSLEIDGLQRNNVFWKHKIIGKNIQSLNNVKEE